MHIKHTLITFAVFLSACSASVSADDIKPELVLSITAEKEVLVIKENGKAETIYQEAENIQPGDVLRYTLYYINKGNAEAKEAVINDPLPEGTSYINGSASGRNSEITFSIDGKIFQAPSLLKYKVKQPDNTEVEYTASPEMYKHIRWRLLKPVMPGESGFLSFKARVK